MTPDGCVFRACTGSDALDVASGTCVPQAGVAIAACGPALAPIVSDGRVACVAPDERCPRGTRLDADRCVRPVQCPPGSLPDARSRAPTCRPVATLGSSPGGESSAGENVTVDVGAWAALVLGADGGPGAAQLCRPLAQRPDAFGAWRALGLSKSGPSAVRLRISLTFPDQDVARVHASVEVKPDAPPGSPEPAGPLFSSAGQPAQAAADEAVATLLEPLRGLGGDSSAREVKVEVRCPLVLP
jgi:hypothetical protein